MYDINISATSIPSDIHLISSAPMFTLHQQDQQFYEQMFESLADVIGYKPKHHEPYNNQSCRSIHHQKLRNTRSTLATACNRDHLLNNHFKQQSLRTAQKQLQHDDQQQSQYNQFHPIAQYSDQQFILNDISPYCLQQQHQLQQHCLTIEELKTTRNSCWLCGCNWREGHVSLDCPECDGYALNRPCPNCDGKCKQVWQRNITATHDKHRALWMGHCAFDDSPAAVVNAQDKDFVSANSSELNEEDSMTATTNGGNISTTTLTSKPSSSLLELQQRGSSQTTTTSAAAAAAATLVVHSDGNTKSTGVGSHFHLLAPSSSSICSSHPSSVASSDDEPDDFLSI